VWLHFPFSSKFNHIHGDTHNVHLRKWNHQQLRAMWLELLKTSSYVTWSFNKVQLRDLISYQRELTLLELSKKSIYITLRSTNVQNSFVQPTLSGTVWRVHYCTTHSTNSTIQFTYTHIWVLKVCCWIKCSYYTQKCKLFTLVRISLTGARTCFMKTMYSTVNTPALRLYMA